jgi:hypothetical protein
VQAAGCAFSGDECDDIGAFVRAAAKLKSGDMAFRRCESVQLSRSMYVAF